MASRATGNRSGADLRESDQLEGLLEIGRGLVSHLDLESTLSSLLEVARELTGARFAAVGTLDGDRRELEHFLTSAGDRRGREAIDELARSRGLLELLVGHPTPLRLDDIGDHAAAAGFLAVHPEMTPFLGVPIIIRGEALGTFYLTESPAGTFNEKDERSVIALAGWAAVAIENARLYDAAERHRKDLGQAVRGLEATVAIARAIGVETQLDRVLEMIVERARALIEARAMVILLAEGDDLVLAARAGEVDEACLGRRVPLAGSVFERVLRREALEQVLDPFEGAVPELAELCKSSALVVPLRYRGRDVGLMVAVAAPEQSGGFRAEHAGLLDSVAVSASIAVWTARTAEDGRARRGLQAAEAERTRWARELHDGTLQGLGALQISLAAARSTVDPSLRDQVLAQAEDQATEEISQLRALITDLRPVALDELGIAAALEALVDRSRRASGIQIEISTDFGFEAGRTASRHVPELETAIYRIIQEALGNAVKHAGATRIDVSVRDLDDRVELIVTDDGRGFDVQSSRTGFGLTGMRERVELERGTLRVISRPGEGTRVEVMLPARRRPMA